MTGFFPSGAFCLPCPFFCSSCTGLDSCSSLKNNSDNKGKGLININGLIRLILCDKGCVECAENNPSTCLECKVGSYLGTNGKCKPCQKSSNCKSCDATNSTLCLTCFPNSFLTNGICSVCEFPCITCTETNTSSCTSCPKGFLLSSGTCLASQCPLYCEECDSNTTCV